MKSNLIENIEKKFKIQVVNEYKNKFDEQFIKCKDLEDNEIFDVKILYGENIETTFKRVFGLR